MRLTVPASERAEVTARIEIQFLFSTLACLFELYGNTHMDALSVHLGLTGLPRIVFSLGPLLVAVAAYSWLLCRLRRMSKDGAELPG